MTESSRFWMVIDAAVAEKIARRDPKFLALAGIGADGLPLADAELARVAGVTPKTEADARQTVYFDSLA